MLPITKVRRVPTPMYPRTRPAVAIPRPTCVPCEALIWPCARWPKITANTDPIQKSQRMPSTNDATARPLDRALSVAAVLPSASRMVNPFSIERWTRLGTNRQTDPLQRGATSSTISRPRERIGVFGAFAAGRVCHRSQEPRDRRGDAYSAHPRSSIGRRSGRGHSSSCVPGGRAHWPSLSSSVNSSLTYCEIDSPSRVAWPAMSSTALARAYSPKSVSSSRCFLAVLPPPVGLVQAETRRRLRFRSRRGLGSCRQVHGQRYRLRRSHLDPLRGVSDLNHHHG